MVSFDEFAAELRAFDGRKAVINEIRKDLRKPLPALRRDIRRNTMRLPSTGGLNAWVASSRITIRFRDAGRSAGVVIKMSRQSTKNKAELNKLDLTGMVRHPLHGNRRHWYNQQTGGKGFFTDAWDKAAWLQITDAAFDRALEKIRSG